MKTCHFDLAGVPAFTNSAADVAGTAQCFWPHPTARAASEQFLPTA